MQSKQRKHPGSPPHKKFNSVHSAGKVMTSIFWDSQGVIMFDYLEQGRMINGAYYMYAGSVRWLRQENARKRRGKLTRGVLLLQNNAPVHTSQAAMTAATECEFGIFPHPSYSPDMAPSDFFLFPELKSHIRAFYFEGIRKLEQRWAKYIALKGDYIEK